MAIGAGRSDVLKMVLRQGMTLAVIGVVIGVLSALTLTRFIGSMMFGITPTDPATYALITCLLVAVAMLACYLPARRATKVDPMVALRCD